MSMIARAAALFKFMHEHHHGGSESAIPASQMDGKISTAGSSTCQVTVRFIVNIELKS
jgi:hypothetical protein